MFCSLSQSDGHGVSPTEDTVPHDAVSFGRVSGGQQHPAQPVTSFLHTKHQLPVIYSSMVIWISEHPASFFESFGFFLVDMALHAGLSSGDEHGVPQSESSQSYCHRAGQNPEEDDTFV